MFYNQISNTYNWFLICTIFYLNEKAFNNQDIKVFIKVIIYQEN